MNQLKRLFFLFLCACCIGMTFSCREQPLPPVDDATLNGAEEENDMEEKSALTDEDFLRAQGSKLLNARGEEVILRGVNLGGWLIQESWMCPINGEDGEWGNLDTIEAFRQSGMSEEQIGALFETYQEHWITEYDLDIIAESGANCVRVPFWYRNFMKDEAGTWITEDPDENPGFEKLDWVIREAGERGMYVILDMHGCPGGQSMNHCCGTVGRKDLYTDPVCRATMKTLWVAIAERYKDSPVVASYDIMNEPQNNSGFESEPNYLSAWSQEAWDETNALYDEMITAVREVDEKHVITVEGIWRIGNLPKPSEAGWTNMLYQVHLYDNTKQFGALCEAISNYAKFNSVPVYVGEFSNMDGVELCEEYGIHWTTWSYKGGKGENGNWFWYSASLTPVIAGETSFEEALTLWGDALLTENGFVRNETVLDTVTAVTQGK